MTDMKVGLIQQSCGPDKESNLQKTIDMVIRAASEGAKLVVLQELHASPYFCQAEETANFDLAEPIPGPTSQHLAALAQSLKVVIVASIFEKRAPGIYHNTALVLESDGSLAGKYRKMHIPDDPAYYEKFYFTPGDLGFKPIETSVGKLGVLVCWDQWYPEAARLMALAGAELLIYPTAIGWTPSDEPAEKNLQRDAWVVSQRAHGIANGLPIISVNRVGFEPVAYSCKKNIEEGLIFWGSSFVSGPQGEIIKMATTDQEEVLVVEIDKAHSEDVRRIWPFFRDRRIDAYGELIKRFID
jgi:N-carbamoylputrescine amidase